LLFIALGKNKYDEDDVYKFCVIHSRIQKDSVVDILERGIEHRGYRRHVVVFI